MADGRRTMIAGAISVALATAFGAGWIGDLAVPQTYPSVAGYVVPGLDEPVVDRGSLQRSWPAGLDDPGSQVRLIGYMTKVDRGAIPAPALATPAVVAIAEPEVDLGTRLATADPERGKSTVKICMSCHNFTKGGPNLVGPNLWGVVGRDVGTHTGFAYSPAMSTHPGSWTYEELDQYIARPSRVVPGNKMAFAGIRNGADRANVLAFLATLNETRVPFPVPKSMTNKDDKAR